jgi:hypothetical protein
MQARITQFVLPVQARQERRCRMEQQPMAEAANPLVLDFVEWIAREPRLYSEVIATWRTSCPRLTIWEDAADGGYVVRETIAGFGMIVTVTEDGEKLLREHGRKG